MRGPARVLLWERGAREEALLLDRARDALIDAFGTAADDLSLRIHHGVLTIRGEVEQLNDIDRYEAVVRRVPGVVEVDNLVRLRLAGRIRPRVLTA
jgi:osmotically-inducible protein OsmY